MSDAMASSSRPAPTSVTPHAAAMVPALTALGDQFSLVAADAVVARRRPTAAPWASILAPTLVVLAVVAGLSVRSAPAADAQVVRAAELASAQATGRFTMTTVGPGVDLSTAGTYDRVTGRVRTVVDLSRVAAAGTSVGSDPSATSGPAASPGMAGLGQPIETIEDGSMLYLRADVFTRSLPGHPAWVRVDTAALDPGSAIAMAVGLDTSGPDPSSFLVALQGIGADTHVVAHEDLAGTATTHYRGTVSLASAADRLEPADRKALSRTFDRLGVDTASLTLPMDVWIGERGEVRRVRTDVTVADPGHPVTVTTDYADLGTPEAIDLPAPDDVTDITGLVNRALDGPLRGLTPN